MEYDVEITFYNVEAESPEQAIQLFRHRLLAGTLNVYVRDSDGDDCDFVEYPFEGFHHG